MASKAQLYLMTSLLGFEQFKVIDYDCVERIGIFFKIEKRERKVFEESRDWGEGLLKLSDWLRESREMFPSSYQTIKRWIGEIIAYFDRRTTQGVVEGINNKLKLIKRRAYGFRNFDNFKLISFLNWHFST